MIEALITHTGKIRAELISHLRQSWNLKELIRKLVVFLKEGAGLGSGEGGGGDSGVIQRALEGNSLKTKQRDLKSNDFVF